MTYRIACLPETCETLQNASLSQIDAMDIYRQADRPGKAQLHTWLHDNPPIALGELERIRWAQAAVALLPDTSAVTKAALRRGDSELAFSIYCAMTNADEAQIDDEMLAIALRAAREEGDGDLVYMAVRVLATWKHRPVVAKHLPRLLQKYPYVFELTSGLGPN